MLRRRRTRTRAATDDVHVFLIWPTAAAHADRILADIEQLFCVHELIRVRWTGERFAENLGRFYGPALPPGVDKLTETGQGDLQVVVISDPAPRYRLRRRTVGRARVNANVFDAKQRYRSWTGGGHLVHATNDRLEAERDLFLLFARTVESVAPSDCRTRPAVQLVESDLVGATGWSSLQELLTAVELSGGYALLNPDEPEPPRLVTRDAWAAEILKARPAGDGRYHEALIAGAPTPLELSWVGDDSLPAAWQEAIVRDATRAASGVLVAAPADRFYARVERLLRSDVRPSAEEAAALRRLGESAGVPPGDYGDRTFLRATLDAFLSSRRARG